MEIFLLGLAIGAFFFGSSIGRDIGRREVLRDMRRQIDNALQNNSEFHQEWKIKGGYFSLDFFGNSPHGIGYDSTYSGIFLVVDSNDLSSQLNPPAR